MTQILLVRHAVNDFVKTGKLAGWTPEVHLNDDGKAQAEALGKRLADVPIKALYASPLERTMETAEAILQHHPALAIVQSVEIGEVRYGDWEGMEIKALAQRKMWHVVQEYPSRAYFPNGETMRDVQIRAVNEIERLAAAHPRDLVVDRQPRRPDQDGTGSFSGNAPGQFSANRRFAGFNQQLDPRLWSPLRGNDQRCCSRSTDGT